MKFVALPAQVKVQFILSRFKITIYARFWCFVKLATHSAKPMTYRRSISHDIFSFEW